MMMIMIMIAKLCACFDTFIQLNLHLLLEKVDNISLVWPANAIGVSL
jgi:hypothetical protein